ncbi:uncharacterized protein LOC129410000, partial [Boleophthalmus pectinirostris]|uniref:uncharacterized protein LOC129410000 n=1 Tax=Boleophthalmus pectinirostris TaxID=150288 RepID=UPI00243303D5
MTKSGRTDMLTVHAIGWNKRKADKLHYSLAKRFLKTLQRITDASEDLNKLAHELSLTEDTMAQWVSDVQQWSAGATTNKIEKNIEELYLSIKQHKYYLYGQSAGNRSRAKQRQKIAQEKRKLEIALSEYNQTHDSQLPDANSILSEDHYSWPWECHGICGNKKRTFDKILLLTRLQEEKVILVSEIKRHYEFLKNAAVTLEELLRHLLKIWKTD